MMMLQHTIMKKGRTEPKQSCATRTIVSTNGAAGTFTVPVFRSEIKSSIWTDVIYAQLSQATTVFIHHTSRHTPKICLYQNLKVTTFCRERGYWWPLTHDGDFYHPFWGNLQRNRYPFVGRTTYYPLCDDHFKKFTTLVGRTYYPI
jgi:hypothetical protein